MQLCQALDGAGQSWLFAIILTVLASTFFCLRSGRKASGQTSGSQVDSEKSAFNRLQNACRNNNIALTHSARHAWLKWSLPVRSPISSSFTLKDFALSRGDEPLSTQSERLEEALISADDNWRGSELLTALQRVRRQINKQNSARSKATLAPLNP